MDFEDYVAARHGALLRAAVLLGVPVEQAPAVVDRVLAASTRRIRRSADPHDEVLDALVAAVPGGATTAFGAASDQVRSEQLMASPIVETRAGAAPELATPAAYVPSARREPPPWLALAGALAVALLLLAGGDALRMAAAPTPARPVAAPAVPLGPGQVPSLFGDDRTAALRTLGLRGARVRIQTEESCEVSGRALGSEPSVGAPLTPGEAVTVFLAVPAGPACGIGPVGSLGNERRAIAWQLIDFAERHGPPPAFARTVSLVVGTGGTSMLTRSQARGRSAWGSVLDEVATAAGRVGLQGSTYVVPVLQVGVARDSSITLRIALPHRAEPASPALRLRVHTDPAGRIDAVTVLRP